MRYLINYDLNRPGQNYQRLYDLLTAWGAKRVLSSTWILRGATKLNVVWMRDTLMQYIDRNDRLLVAEMSDGAAYNILVDINTI